MSDLAVREALTRLLDVHGVLHPEAVVQAAREPGSPLHKHFTWDDAAAAHAHRLDQARTLIRTVKIEVVSETISLSVPAFVTAPGERSGYRLLERVRDDREAARQAMLTEVERAQSALRRAQVVAAGLGLLAPVTDAMERVSVLREVAQGIRDSVAAPAQQANH
jgi:hypothetical protein